MDELVKQAMNSLKLKHVEPHLAQTAEEAQKIIGKLVGRNKLVVKAKNSVDEEIKLGKFLETQGNTIYDTDFIGFIAQQLKKPRNHLRENDAAELLTKTSGKEITPDNMDEMVATVREYMKEKFFKADVGISGADIVSADTGTIFLMENEGNIRLVTATPNMHIALIGIEKVVPTFQDACKVSEAILLSAKCKMVSYMSLISGLSATGDIEKRVTFGAHGPKEMYVVFLDNGRSKFARDPERRKHLLELKAEFLKS